MTSNPQLHEGTLQTATTCDNGECWCHEQRTSKTIVERMSAANAFESPETANLWLAQGIREIGRLQRELAESERLRGLANDACESFRNRIEHLERRSEPPSAALRDVAAERERQKSVEGWTPEHDDKHKDGELASAAFGYTYNAMFGSPEYAKELPPFHWPWHESWWKPTTVRRDLVKAGALILAEIERLDRAAVTKVDAL